jgi:DAK2 domain fusion protein YloV
VTRVYDGATLRTFYQAATARLDQDKEHINRINTFPIPDGDSGTNMWYTMAAAARAAEEETSHHAGEVARKASRGALLHARGNSGIILSQILTGFARGLTGKERFTPPDFAEALTEASEAAYRSVSEPVEGTILTVLREGAGVAREWGSRVQDLPALLDRVVAAQRDALARTPDLLPRLKEAGVVDAGGLGLLTIFEAMRDALGAQVVAASRAQLAERGQSVRRGGRIQAPLPSPEARYGVEVQCLLLGASADLREIQNVLRQLGDSVLVVGDPSEAKVHVHTLRPQEAVDFLAGLGDLAQLTFEDLDAMARAFGEPSD